MTKNHESNGRQDAACASGADGPALRETSADSPGPQAQAGGLEDGTRIDTDVTDCHGSSGWALGAWESAPSTFPSPVPGFLSRSRLTGGRAAIKLIGGNAATHAARG